MDDNIEWLLQTTLHLSLASQLIQQEGKVVQIDYLGLANHLPIRALHDQRQERHLRKLGKDFKRLMKILPADPIEAGYLESYEIHDMDTLDPHYLWRFATRDMSQLMLTTLPVFGDFVMPIEIHGSQITIYSVSVLYGIEAHLTGQSMIYLGKVRRIRARDYPQKPVEMLKSWTVDVVRAAARQAGPKNIGEHVEILEAIDPRTSERIQMLRVPVKVTKRQDVRLASEQTRICRPGWMN